MTIKKEIKNRKTATKKAVTKKATNKVTKITEEQVTLLKDEINKEIGENVAEEQKVDWDKYKVKEGEYDLTNASKEEVTSAFKDMESEDKIIVTKNGSIVVEETEVMNGDPAVLTPKEEPKEKPKVEDKKENKPKIAKKINKLFTYFWNGQMIDF